MYSAAFGQTLEKFLDEECGSGPSYLEDLSQSHRVADRWAAASEKLAREAQTPDERLLALRIWALSRLLLVFVIQEQRMSLYKRLASVQVKRR